MVLGDARSGKLTDNLTGFGRMLRRAGLPMDTARISLAHQALGLIDLGDKSDVQAALSTVLVSREQDRLVFNELFEAYFKDPQIAKQLMAQLLPQAKAPSPATSRRARTQEALQVPKAPAAHKPTQEQKVDLDAAMTASDRARLRHADFNSLSASEFLLIEQLVRDIALPLPKHATRRRRVARRGDGLHWPKLMQALGRHAGDIIDLPRSQRRSQELPVLVLVDVSGSMERYARLMLAFLHRATYRKQRHVFAFGTQITNLDQAFDEPDSDEMLRLANLAVADFGGGTRLGQALRSIRENYRHTVIGNRTLVLLITDGLDTGDADMLQQELRWLTQQAKTSVWLNPLLRYDGYAPLAAGAKVLHRSVDQMLAIHNLDHLKMLASALASLMKRVS